MLLTACVRVHCVWFANDIGQGCCNWIVVRFNFLIAVGEIMFIWLPVSNKTVMGVLLT